MKKKGARRCHRRAWLLGVPLAFSISKRWHKRHAERERERNRPWTSRRTEAIKHKPEACLGQHACKWHHTSTIRHAMTMSISFNKPRRSQRFLSRSRVDHNSFKSMHEEEPGGVLLACSWLPGPLLLLASSWLLQRELNA